MPKLAIIHTSPATLDPLKALASELLPGVEVVNFVDDSILPQLAHNGGRLDAVSGRLVQYARFAEDVGADVILSACSSVGEGLPLLRAAVDIPVVRIDDAMAAAAVARGTRIGVAATVATTLEPTKRLLQAHAEAAGKHINLEPCLISTAYQKLMAGDKQGHDDDLVEALVALAAAVDVVVLAQVSMARVLPRIAEDLRSKVLTSPRLAMQAVRDVMSEQGLAPA
jgi:Asp/Glu/hydantoin racemase